MPPLVDDVDDVDDFEVLDVVDLVVLLALVLVELLDPEVTLVVVALLESEKVESVGTLLLPNASVAVVTSGTLIDPVSVATFAVETSVGNS
ncbi:hypothetical protein HK405_009366, partial [Cladochytrium tenue]